MRKTFKYIFFVTALAALTLYTMIFSVGEYDWMLGESEELKSYCSLPLTDDVHPILYSFFAIAFVCLFPFVAMFTGKKMVFIWACLFFYATYEFLIKRNYCF